MPGMEKLLVVDDEADIRRAFRRNLESASWHIVEAVDGLDAIRQVAAEQPHLVVMDIRMAGTSGLETLRKLRELNPKLLVIMMTAYGTTQTAIEAMKLGAYDYVLKPIDLQKLDRVISEALKVSRLMREPAVVAETPPDDELPG